MGGSRKETFRNHESNTLGGNMIRNTLIVLGAVLVGILLFTQHGAQGSLQPELELLVDVPDCDSLATVYVHLRGEEDLAGAPVDVLINGQKETLRTDQNGRFFTMAEAECGKALEVMANYDGDRSHSSISTQKKIMPIGIDVPSRIAELQKSIVKVELPDSRGSGVVIEHGARTFILTNKHVVDPAERYKEITVITSEGKEYHPVAVRYGPKEMDFAILEVEEQIGVPVRIAENYRQGEDVVALGSPRGIQGSVSKGIISNLGFDETKGGYDYQTIQTDAAINTGNSGGGLFMVRTGELIGINSFRYKNAEGLNFAVDIAELSKLGDYHNWKEW